jgi:hypothetical protein
VVDRVNNEYDGDSGEEWSDRTSGVGHIIEIRAPGSKSVMSVTQLGNCNMFAWNITLTNNNEYRVYSTWLSIHKDDIADITAWKTFLSSNHLQVVWKLATPVTYQLTQGQVKTLLGVNNIWADTGNILSVDYPADTKLYIDNKFAELSAVITALGT